MTSCPRLLGTPLLTTGNYRGLWYRIGSGSIDDPAEVLVTNGWDLYRYNRLDMSFIEYWNNTVTNAAAMDVANDRLYTIDTDGILRYRSPVTSDGDIVTPSGVNIGYHENNAMVMSPYDKN